jgi:small subunit ribosomal protein S16
MVKIRLRRTGAKKQPHYRVVVADSRAPRDGKFIETIGHYNPRTEPATVEIDAERALYWLSVGAQPSPAVKHMLDKMGILAQVPAARKGEVSVEKLAAEFRAQAEEEAPFLAGALEEERIEEEEFELGEEEYEADEEEEDDEGLDLDDEEEEEDEDYEDVDQDADEFEFEDEDEFEDDFEDEDEDEEEDDDFED